MMELCIALRWINCSRPMVNKTAQKFCKVKLPRPIFATACRYRSARNWYTCDLLNQDRVANGEAEIRIGIGIATGEVVAGYIGTASRAMYTCIGSSVNMAALLESHTKDISCTLLIDQTTQAGLDGDVEMQHRPAADIRGFAEPVDPFSL